MLNLEEVKKTMQSSRFIKMVARYQYLMENLHSVDISEHADFQRTYNCFFQLRRNQVYRKQHFTFMENHKHNAKTSFKEILTFLSSIQDTTEASFASKMLSIINPDMPVLDSKVLQKLKIKKSAKSTLDEAVNIYNQICDWYDDFVETETFKSWINLFDEHFPNSGISAAKKIDFVLWQMD